MSTTASPARDTARSAAATKETCSGKERNSLVWLRNTRRGDIATDARYLPAAHWPPEPPGCPRQTVPGYEPAPPSPLLVGVCCAGGMSRPCALGRQHRGAVVPDPVRARVLLRRRSSGQAGP